MSLFNNLFLLFATLSLVIPVFVVPHVSGLISVVALIHAPLGAVAVSLGLWLAFSWRSSGTASCFKRKRYMLATITVWLAGLSLGIILYAVLYWTVLMS